MAKTKAKGLKVEIAEPEYIPSLYIDLEDPEDVSGLAVGKKVTVMVTGTIESIRLEKNRSSLCLCPFEAEVASKNPYEELAEDD